MTFNFSKEQCYDMFRDLLSKSNLHHDGWELHAFKEDIYLIKRVTKTVSGIHKEDGGNGAKIPGNESDSECQTDDSCDVLTNHDTTSTLTFHYHVLFSESYSVPVLYCNVFWPSGRLLSLEQLWALVPEQYQSRMLEDRWTFLTQTEHPYLQRPFFQLHPCHTGRLLGVVSTLPSSKGSNYVISWLSAVGPVVRLNLPFHYGRLNTKQEVLSMRTITKEKYGSMEDGRDIYQYTLTNRQNLEVRIIEYGGRITHLFTPDRNGKLEDIVLGYDSYIDGYDKDEFYLGALIGRYANRIAKGQFTLDGVTYQLGINNGPNTNHGGFRGFDKKLWGSTVENGKVVLTYTSADMEEGFPGEVKVTVTIALTQEDEVVIDYTATTTKPTVINLTTHPYFNLHGHSSGDLKGQVIRISTGLHTPLDSNQIPTGDFDEGKDTALDLHQSTDISEAQEHVPGGYGYDHNFALMHPGIEKHAANVFHASSGRVLDMFTTEPGMQFYTGYWLDIPRGKSGAKYGKWSGFCLEAQKYPDSPNKPHFPSAVIRPDETYRQTTKYVFSTMES